MFGAVVGVFVSMMGVDEKSEHWLLQGLTRDPLLFPPSPKRPPLLELSPLLVPLPLSPPVLEPAACVPDAQLARMHAPTRVRIPPPCKAKEPKAAPVFIAYLYLPCRMHVRQPSAYSP
jgi:hypothetical protein